MPVKNNTPDVKNDVRILVASDDLSGGETLRDLISSWGFVGRAVARDEVLEEAQNFAPHVLLVDLKAQQKDGESLLPELQTRGIEVATVVMAEEADLRSLERTIKPGACDYISKPINPNNLRVLLNELATQLKVSEENQQLRRKLIEAGTLGPIVGQSTAMRRVMRLVEEAASSNSAPVSIVGESGTGKKLVARTIHELSARRNGPYVAVTCTGLPDDLMESELWGHERGAFAGADRRREGFLAMANGGTLLLDEISDLKVELQAKLLRTIEDKKLHRIGAHNGNEIPLDVRLIASSSKSPTEAMRYGRLREDLFSHLNTFVIELPPLRDRLEDIPALVEAFIAQSAEKNRKSITGVDNECLEILRLNRWPGNVLQLRNVIERATVVARRPLLAAGDLPVDIRRAGRKGPHFELRIGESLDEVEREFIFKTLDFTNGNKVRAAQILGISLKTLYNRLVRYQGKDRDPGVESSRHN
ncbi:sigma-54-dependent transcriptional regulator [Candidatus Binatus sp.]|uniref:sigma-54-dependent transcriptional regulator n=1 Tax=Candidatus Binatus sp. TaxID=2811406 RepID=UPI003CC60C6E